MSPRNTADAQARAAARDRGLRRVSTATGWITAASAVSAVALAGGYAQALPGTSTSAVVPAVPAAAATRDATAPSPSSTSNSGAASSTPTDASVPTLRAPAQAPTTAASTPHVTSGGT